MKSQLVVLSLFMVNNLLAQVGNGEELSEEGIKRFEDNEKGQIIYTISGDASGKITYEFSHWGWKEKKVREMEYTLFGMQTDENKLEMRDGDFTFTADLKTKKGKISKNQTESDLLRYKSPEETIESLYLGMGGVVARQDTILGMTVNVWQFEKGNTLEIWESKGLILKGKRKFSKIIYEYTAEEFIPKMDLNVITPQDISWEN